jgi:RimJ/RimL family protein N-acetyltransferase
VIETARFSLRPLTVADASDRYLSWLRDRDAVKYIVASASTRGLDDLRAFIAARAGRDDVLLLGIFDRESGTHVGNIKYEPVDSVAGYAVMGILIGEPTYRGRGVTGEVLRATAEWLRTHRQIRQVVLGVDTDNHAAIRAYEKVGFVHAATPHIAPSSGAITMVWDL